MCLSFGMAIVAKRRYSLSCVNCIRRCHPLMSTTSQEFSLRPQTTTLAHTHVHTEMKPGEMKIAHNFYFFASHKGNPFWLVSFIFSHFQWMEREPSIHFCGRTILSHRRQRAVSHVKYTYGVFFFVIRVMHHFVNVVDIDVVIVAAADGGIKIYHFCLCALCAQPSAASKTLVKVP